MTAPFIFLPEHANRFAGSLVDSYAHLAALFELSSHRLELGVLFSTGAGLMLGSMLVRRLARLVVRTNTAETPAKPSATKVVPLAEGME